VITQTASTLSGGFSMAGVPTYEDLDGSRLNDAREWDVGDVVTASIGMVSSNGVAIGAAVVTVEFSNDGVTWFGFSPTAVTLTSASPHSGTMDVSTVYRLRARVSTVNASAPRLRLSACGKGD
jgi:hypothetical protein